MKPVRPTILIAFLSLVIQLLSGPAVRAEDGYRLWLRYDQLPPEAIEAYSRRVSAIVISGDSPAMRAIGDEVTQGCSGLLGRRVPLTDLIDREGVVIIGTPASSPVIAGLKWGRDLRALGSDGYLIRAATIRGHSVTVIASNDATGLVYGTFRFLRLLQTLSPIENLRIAEKPRLERRLLNHWDNLDGSVERGYAGKSLWNWAELPDRVDERYRDYARANASIGINGSVLNNVNANSKSLTTEYLRKAAAIAGVFRPYGIRVYLSARFSAPIEIGGLKTADPLDPEVAKWWKLKVDEIYRIIPDFGGFVVKANSEGQPGPRTYNRTHADGANMMAAALAPHGGIVMWRAFVYDAKPGYDRAGAASENLGPFDGKFAPNVLLQVKNGPIDFQPREPFHPLFGAMPKTQLMPELQITQEYLGFSNHLVFLAPMWREFLQSDTRGRGSTVTKVVDSSRQRLTGMAGVANSGSSRNWTGHDFAQANWYAFGRLAWNPDLTSEEIAREWIAMTLTRDSSSARKIERMMLESHEAAVDYMTPLGLHHIMWPGHHYGPAPWWDKGERDDWNSVYYHRADDKGIGFDRTSAGSNSIRHYHKAVSDLFGNLKSCPEKYLLWFHRVPWDYRMRSGRILWDELALHYQRGVDWTRNARKLWSELDGDVDADRHQAVGRKLEIQERDAIVWRDACLLYFQTFSKRPLPSGVEKPLKTLEEYKARSLDWQ